MGHFLQITIARKTLPFLTRNYRISCDPKMQKWVTFCKLRLQEKLYHFPRETIQFLVITKCRMGHFLQIMITRKTRPFLKKNYTISHDHELQKWATLCKLRSQQKLYHIPRETIEFLVIAKCRNGPLSANYDRRNGSLSANYDRKKTYTISRDHELQKWATFCELRSQQKLYHFSRETIELLVIAKCKNGPLSANYDHKKNFTISQGKLHNFS